MKNTSKLVIVFIVILNMTACTTSPLVTIVIDKSSVRLEQDIKKENKWQSL